MTALVERQELVSVRVDDVELVAKVVADRSRARALLDALPLQRLSQAGIAELCNAGLDRDEALRLQAALELGRRAVDEPLQRGAPMRSRRDVVARLRGRLSTLEHEELHVLGLDGAHRLVVHAVAAVGAINVVYTQAREVFRPLIREGAVAAILVHNHPSGSIAPSESDIELTLRVAQAGVLIGITLLDHVVLARGRSFSFAEAKLMPEVA